MNESLAATTEDSELLRRYAEEGSEGAFAELVRRRIGLVYAVALRQTGGDRHRAEDATQAVFTDLARKARSLTTRPVLAGWLYRSARFASAGLVRAEQRRQAREREAHLMEKNAASDEPEADWEKLRPVIDEALSEIEERDRDAIVLRFFDGRAYGEIGERLRVTDNAARMRVSRALEKLQEALAHRGITSTTSAVGLALANQVAAAAPAGLAGMVTGAALAGSAAGGAATLLMGMTKLQLAALAVIAGGGVTGYVMQAETHAALRREIAAAQVSPLVLAALQAENQRMTQAASEVDVLRRDDVELKRLEQQVVEVREAQRLRTVEARRAQTPPSYAEVTAQVQELDKAMVAEVDAMNREGNTLVERFKELTAQANDPLGDAAAREQAKAGAAALMQTIKAKQKEIQEFIQAGRARLNQMLRESAAQNGIAPPPMAPVAPTESMGQRLELRRKD